MNKNYKIKNIGKTITYVYNGTKPPKKNDIEWSIDYDNKHGVDLNVNNNNDGDKSHYHQYLTNSEVEELLKMPVVDKSIHQRLLEDFNPYNNNDTTNFNNNLDLITYPRQNTQQPYDPITQYSSYPDNMQTPIFFQTPSESSPKVIKIKIYTKKHKKHSNKNHSKSNRLSTINKHPSRSSNHSRSRSRSSSQIKRHTSRMR